MTKKIRFGVFETNSSSTHTLTIVSKEDFDAWKNGDKWYKNIWYYKHDNLYTMQEIQKEFDNCANDKWKPNTIEDYMTRERFQTYDEWVDDDKLGSFKEEYITKSGDKIVVFGKFGYEG